MNSAVWDNRRTYWSAGLSTLIHLAVLFVMAIVPPWVGKGQLDGVAFYPVDLIDESNLPKTALLPRTTVQPTRVPAILPTTHRPQPTTRPAESKTPASPPDHVATPLVSTAPPTATPKTAVTPQTTATVVPTPTALSASSSQTRVLVSTNTTNPPLPQATPKPQPATPVTPPQGNQSVQPVVKQTSEPSLQQQAATPSPISRPASTDETPADLSGSAAQKSLAGQTDHLTTGHGETASAGEADEEGAPNAASLPGTGVQEGVLPAFGNGQEAVLYSIRPLVPKNATISTVDRIIVLSVRVNASGQVEDVTIVSSSGDLDMDKTAAFTIQTAWTFQAMGFPYDLEVTVIYAHDRTTPYGEISIGQWTRVLE